MYHFISDFTIDPVTHPIADAATHPPTHSGTTLTTQPLTHPLCVCRSGGDPFQMNRSVDMQGFMKEPTIWGERDMQRLPEFHSMTGRHQANLRRHNRYLIFMSFWLERPPFYCPSSPSRVISPGGSRQNVNKPPIGQRSLYSGRRRSVPLRRSPKPLPVVLHRAQPDGCPPAFASVPHGRVVGHSEGHSFDVFK